ncbi:Flp family type IVb pilin [Sphingomonas sp. MG17]|jgi:pilus assembly protein Flp/PilA|uniref:Flp family type IVb pilin n=1 Tax=Sphingomonas tagetis TaxID=2949092 RepID=A0A9X2HI73_9SPHN|nr:Flp family type IVb pilin [Sphingomonas tagetis]MCP3729351.1 Flp family type IVb pilin [Sphingomonas tagetis]
MRLLGSLYRRLVRDRKGATAVEYGFILALIVIAIIASIQGLAGATTGMWGNVHDKVQKAS